MQYPAQHPMDSVLRTMLWQIANGCCLDCGAEVTPAHVHVRPGCSGREAADFWVSCGTHATTNPSGLPTTTRVLENPDSDYYDKVALSLLERKKESGSAKPKVTNNAWSYYITALDNAKKYSSSSKEAGWVEVLNLRNQIVEQDKRHERDDLHDFDTTALAAVQEHMSNKVPGVSVTDHVMKSWKKFKRERGHSDKVPTQKSSRKVPFEGQTIQVSRGWGRDEEATPSDLLTERNLTAAAASQVIKSYGLSEKAEAALMALVVTYHRLGNKQWQSMTKKQVSNLLEAVHNEYDISLAEARRLYDVTPTVVDVEAGLTAAAERLYTKGAAPENILQLPGLQGINTSKKGPADDLAKITGLDTLLAEISGGFPTEKNLRKVR